MKKQILSLPLLVLCLVALFTTSCKKKTDSQFGTISYPSAKATFFINVKITPIAATFTGDKAQSLTISPALPAGLVFDAATGTISGTPTAVSAATKYTISATYLGGTVVQYSINIAVLATPTIAYTGSPFAYTSGTAITALTPTLNDANPTSFAVSPALPAGLTLNTTTGAISGTPTAVLLATSYTVTVTYPGSVTATTTISIAVAAAPTIAYNGSPFTYTHGTAIATLTPVTTGATPTGYTVAPALPAGLTLNPSTGVISGTPTTATAATDYVVTAAYAGGVASKTATINITVN